MSEEISREEIAALLARESEGTGMITGNILEDIKTIVKECEEYQHSNESEYSKEREILNAYAEIAELITDKREVS